MIKTFPQEYHEKQVDYLNKEEIEKELIRVCRPAKRVNIAIACEDKLRMVYPLPILAAFDSAKILRLLKEVEISVIGKDKELLNLPILSLGQL